MLTVENEVGLSEQWCYPFSSSWCPLSKKKPLNRSLCRFLTNDDGENLDVLSVTIAWRVCCLMSCLIILMLIHQSLATHQKL